LICSMMLNEDCSQVSKKEAMCGGIVFAISAMSSSAIGPGPLGILATRPTALAPAEIAIFASTMEAMQQILTRTFIDAKITSPNLSTGGGEEQRTALAFQTV